jgi:hypothetical protein
MNRPTRISIIRIMDTRRRIERRMWEARAAVIREQLVAQRGTWA